jgi:type II secretory pathway component PulM
MRGLERYEWWQRTSARERAMLVAGASIVVVVLAVTLVAMPIAAALSRAPQARAQRTAELAQARARVDAIRAAAAPLAPVADPRAAVERALARIGIARGAADIDATGERIAVTLPAVRIADVAALMDTLGRDGLVVAGATLAAREGGTDVRAELTLTRDPR